MSITFRIAIADGSWDQGGTIYNDSNVVFPKGTHAIRWKDADWFWYKNFKLVKNHQIFSSESPEVAAYWKKQGDPPVKSYTYVGGLLDDPNTIPQFESPLAGTFSPKMPSTDLVDTLVLQVTNQQDIQFLDKNLNPIHSHPPQGPQGLTSHA
jgi:hypothetical protein